MLIKDDIFTAPQHYFSPFSLALSFGPLLIPSAPSPCLPLTLSFVSLRAFADSSDLSTSHIRSHGEMWITSVSLGQLAGPYWIYTVSLRASTHAFCSCPHSTWASLEITLMNLNRGFINPNYCSKRLPVMFLYGSHFSFEIQAFSFQLTLWCDKCVWAVFPAMVHQKIRLVS